MQKTIWLISGLMLILFISCKKENTTDSTVTSAQDEVVDMHNSQNSLDWSGRYYGTIPCASCPGIDIEIVLNEDGTFEKTEIYQESDMEPIIENGDFTWSENGNQIRLGEFQFKVGENHLIMLDQQGNEVTGALAKDYILTKTYLQSELPVNSNNTLVSYSGSNGMTYNVIFDTVAKPATAVVTSDNDNLQLIQTESAANSAIYEADGASLQINNETAVFNNNGVTVNLTEK